MEQNPAGVVKNDRFAKYIGIRLTRTEPGYAEAELDITDNHLNGLGIVQGGATFTLADYTFAAAANAKGIAAIGISGNISYLAAPKGKKLRAEAREVSSTRKLCHYNIDVFDEMGTLIARMGAMGYLKG